MSFTKSDIEKLAKLSRIELTEAEKEKFRNQLSSILDYMKKIQEVDTTKVRPTFRLDLKNIFREDLVDQYKDIDNLIKQFPQKAGKLNKVKPVLE
jgi:aspartyl-tRNA(Asn)/glutamyl-tRNA(Gln) amidotransferase subunit C